MAVATTGAAFRVIPYEELEPEERRTASAHTLATALADCADAALAIASASIAARQRLVEALVRTVTLPRDDPRFPDAKCTVLEARAMLGMLADRSRALRLLSSVLQTLLRSAAA